MTLQKIADEALAFAMKKARHFIAQEQAKTEKELLQLKTALSNSEFTLDQVLEANKKFSKIFVQLQKVIEAAKTLLAGSTVMNYAHRKNLPSTVMPVDRGHLNVLRAAIAKIEEL